MAIHVYPEAEKSLHDREKDGFACVCAPFIQWHDPATDAPYPSGPMIVHTNMIVGDKETRWCVEETDWEWSEEKPE